jgi:hypothetical protein
MAEMAARGYIAVTVDYGEKKGIYIYMMCRDESE